MIDTIQVVLNLVTSIVTFLGIGGVLFVSNKTISKLIEQKPEIVFGFYSKMKVYLLEIKQKLGDSHKSPLKDSGDAEERQALSIISSDFLCFLKNQDWQVPLNKDVKDNFDMLIKYMLKFSLLEDTKKTSYVANELYSDLEKIQNVITMLLEAIDAEQERIINKYTEVQKDLKS